jgi:hypothetical protein
MDGTKMKEPLDIPEIKKYIKEEHEKFMDQFGPMADKVAADHRLQEEIIYARLLPILICLKQEKVIDKFVASQENYNKRVELVKDGYNASVHITTNGLQIKLEGYVYISNLGMSDLIVEKEIISGVDSDSFDWLSFSKTLLGYIHGSIYERRKAAEVKLVEWGWGY